MKVLSVNCFLLESPIHNQQNLDSSWDKMDYEMTLMDSEGNRHKNNLLVYLKTNKKHKTHVHFYKDT